MNKQEIVAPAHTGNTLFMIMQHILQDRCRGGMLHRHLRCQKQREKYYGSC